jgi:hypothetical protein
MSDNGKLYKIMDKLTWLKIAVNVIRMMAVN